MKAAEAAARTAKAERLAAYLIDQGYTVGDVAKMGRRRQLAVARAAGTRPPGTDGRTWSTVLDVMRGHEALPAVLPEPVCRECGGVLVDHQPVKANRYSEATDELCGRCASVLA